MAGLISKRYAEALFQLALEQNCVDKYSDEVKLVYEALSGESEILKVFNYPEISSEVKFNIIQNALKGSVSDDILGLLQIVFNKNREKELIEILDTFLKRFLIIRVLLLLLLKVLCHLMKRNLMILKKNCLIN